jgi:hypothetical protein
MRYNEKDLKMYTKNKQQQRDKNINIYKSQRKNIWFFVTISQGHSTFPVPLSRSPLDCFDNIPPGSFSCIAACSLVLVGELECVE